MALSKSLDKLKGIVQCAICFEVFSDPVTLKCFHSFCATCIKGWKTEVQRGKDVYSCPVCRSCTERDGLKPVFVMKDLIELYWLVKDENQSCSKCKKQPPKWRCLQCKFNCCPGCKQDHDFFPALRHHKWISFDDKEALLNIEKVVYCEKHPDKVLELECQQCDELICYLCKAVNHEGHQTGTIEQALQRLIPIIQEKEEEIMQNIITTTDGITDIKNEIKDTEKWYEKVQRRLNQQKLDAIEKVKSDHASLVKKLSTLKSQELSKYTSAMQKLENTVKEEQNLIQWTDNILATTSGTSLLRELKAGLQEYLAAKAAIQLNVVVKKPACPAFHPFNISKTGLMGRVDSRKDETKVDTQSIAKYSKPRELLDQNRQDGRTLGSSVERSPEVCSSLEGITETKNALKIDAEKSISDSNSQVSNTSSGSKVDIQSIGKDTKLDEGFESSVQDGGPLVLNEERPPDVCSSLEDITQTENALKIDAEKSKSTSSSNGQVSDTSSEPNEQNCQEAGSNKSFLKKERRDFGITTLLPFQMKTLSDKKLVQDKRITLPFASSSCAILGNDLYFSEFITNAIHLYTSGGISIGIIELPRHIKCRALAVSGKQLVLGSRQGLYFTDKTRRFVIEIDSSPFVAVATHDDVIFALNSSLGVVSRFQNNHKKWEKLDIKLNDFEATFQNESCSFHLQVCTDYIFVSSWKSRVIQQYYSNGQPLKTFSKALTSQLNFPAVCGADASGDLLIADRRLGLLTLSTDGNWQSFTSTTVPKAQFAAAIDSQTICVVTRTVSGAGNTTVHTCHLERFLIK